MSKVECHYENICSGCPHIAQPYDWQKQNKLRHLRNVWDDGGPQSPLPQIQWLKTDLSGFRDRTDMTFQCESGRRFGLYDLDRKKIVDLDNCVIQSPELDSLFREFRNIRFPVKFGSFRLRVGPQGQRGIWLDFPNIAVKELLDERETLLRLMSLGHVEIGQRKKVLIQKEEKLKLADPNPLPWFETYLGRQAKPQNLFCSIADFTQPSMKSNRLLISEVMQLVRATGAESAIEVGAGIGNFTLPMATELNHVQAFELERSACQSLQRNLQESGLDAKVTVVQGDVFRSFDQGTEMPELMLVDPPRSGFARFFEKLLQNSTVAPFQYLVYVSCYAESFAKDAKLLSKFFDLKKMTVLDQFPHTPHFELIALFQAR